MSANTGTAALLGRLLWPERTPVSGDDRDRAAGRISAANASGKITATQAAERQEQAREAENRGELSYAMRELPGVTPANLLLGRKVLTAVWLAGTLLQFVVWMIACLVSLSLVNPFWLWSAVIGGVVVAGMCWATESEYRGAASDNDDRSAR